ncbi:site-specific DNA-methyltransferase [Glaesserella parasuis]|nr:site-specific DNA-methyltransferase [Glaesserella parasuis]MDO9997623.1 site-specific DNA-methyltransferase [Glaesserella parasuis]
MPQLTWIGKDKVKNHHHDVPFHLLEKQYDFKANSDKPENSKNNMLIQGDNLLALKSLLPKYEGKINCIYIDPPYNTGNEKWVYNDNVNDPRIKKWLGEVVGKEGEDLSRHDKWLCMMYPRLKLLHRLLADDGVIIIHIDENEYTNLHSILIEIFGKTNDLGTIIWDKRNPKGDSQKISYQHESIVLFGKNQFHTTHKLKRLKKNAPAMLKKAKMLFKKIGKKQYPENLKKVVKEYNLSTEILEQNKLIADLEWVNQEYQDWLKKQDFSNGEKAYKFIDENGDIFQTVSMAWPNKEKAPDEYFIPLIHPVTKKECPIPEKGWRYPLVTMEKMLKNNEIIFGADEVTQPRSKYLLKENLYENTPSILAFGGSDDKFQKEIGIHFENPKPNEFSTELLSSFLKPNSIVLDSFMGSGTTAHAVLNLNAKDGGNRQFIGIEMMDYAENITAERIRRVINGYGSKAETQKGTGGGFSFYTIGETLFDSDGNLNNQADLISIREYIAHSEKLETVFDNHTSGYFLGLNYQTAYIFYYESDQITTLSLDFLRSLNADFMAEKPQDFVIYADKCTLMDEQLAQFKIRFKRIPRDISKL